MEKQIIPEFLTKMLLNQYGNDITNTILKGYEMKRKVTFRVNTLKSTVEEIEEILNKLNIEYNKTKFNNEVFILKNAMEKDIQKLDIYKEGKIYLQSLSSMIPPIILEPKQEEDILDMAAAPGGKTTQIAAITNNQSNITACELNKIRAEKLKYNLERQGALALVMTNDARQIDDFFSFDNILLDAPCSGSGTISIFDKNLSKYFTEDLIKKTKKSQLQLLRKAIKILKPGKTMVYSTCSILSCENEEIVEQILKESNCEIVPISVKEEIPILPTKLEGTLCICPNELYEGFFIAKLKKKI